MKPRPPTKAPARPAFFTAYPVQKPATEPNESVPANAPASSAVGGVNVVGNETSCGCAAGRAGRRLRRPFWVRFGG